MTYLLAASRSWGWLWLVGVGLVVALGFALVVARGVLAALPEDIQEPVRRAVKQNGPPLGVGIVMLIGTIVFALYSAGLPAPTSTDDATGLTAGQAADDTAVGDTSEETAGDAGASTGASGDGAVGSGAPGSAGRTPGAGAARTAGGGISVGAPKLDVKDASLWSGGANTRGITSSSIKVCGHAPLNLGPALNTKPEDLLVFWRWLNEQGGIHGRTFDVSLEDDQYTAEGGVPAAQACAEKNPFMIFGSIGSDVLPPVRVWAEQNKELYLYGFTVKKGSENFKYSYSTVIPQEDLSAVTADLALAKYPGKKIGLMWRNSANVQPGRDVFKRKIEAGGGKIVADLPVTRNQGTYTSEIITMEQAGAELVFVLEDALTQTNIIKQAKTQQYSPQWLVFAFNLQTQTLGNDAMTPPLAGTSLGPAYECNQHGGPYASYAAEIKLFEAAYAKYSPNTDLCGIAGDIAFQSWQAFKNVAGLFEACGRNCTRNRFAGVMDSGYKGAVGAACPLDFTRGHHGGSAADIFEAYNGPNGRPAWRNPTRCQKAT